MVDPNTTGLGAAFCDGAVREIDGGEALIRTFPAGDILFVRVDGRDLDGNVVEAEKDLFADAVGAQPLGTTTLPFPETIYGQTNFNFFRWSTP